MQLYLLRYPGAAKSRQNCDLPGYRSPFMSLASVITDLERFERSIVHWVTCHAHSDTLAPVFRAVQSEWIGFPLFLFGLSLVARTRRDAAVRALLAGAASFGICMGIATIMWQSIDRERPPHHYDRWLETDAELAACASRPDAFAVRGHVSFRPAFPSRHALSITSFVGALLLASRRIGLVAVAYGLFVLFGRVYVGKHWPSDLLAGVCIASVVVAACWRLVPAVLGRVGLWEAPESKLGSEANSAHG